MDGRVFDGRWIRLAPAELRTKAQELSGFNNVLKVQSLCCQNVIGELTYC
jgi:hypothetical protein